MATKKIYFLKIWHKKFKFSKYFYCFLGSRRFSHLPIQHSLDRQWLQEDLQEVALPTLTRERFLKSCFICGKTHILQNEKDIVAKKIFTLLAEAAIKAATKEMCNFYFQNKTSISSLMSFFISTLAINYLLQATVVVLEKLL